MYINPQFLDTSERWENYCKERGIKNPLFSRPGQLYPKKFNFLDSEIEGYVHKTDFNGIEVEKFYSREEMDEYLRLRGIFFMWDYHFWMIDWDNFQKHGDSEGYYPCDLANRQCNMACKYFGEKCPRESEELKCPKELDFEGRWEIKS